MTSFEQTTLHTDRLLLRPLGDQDAPALFDIFSNPTVARYLSRPAWPAIATARERIARDIEAMAIGKYLCLGVVRKGDMKLVGECSLFNLVEQCRRAEIGYALGADAWGHGYMAEASEPGFASPRVKTSCRSSATNEPTMLAASGAARFCTRSSVTVHSFT